MPRSRNYISRALFRRRRDGLSVMEVDLFSRYILYLLGYGRCVPTLGVGNTWFGALFVRYSCREGSNRAGSTISGPFIRGMFVPTSRQRGRREAGRMDRGSAMTLFKELEKKGRELEKQAEHWKAQHSRMARRTRRS